MGEIIDALLDNKMVQWIWTGIKKSAKIAFFAGLSVFLLELGEYLSVIPEGTVPPQYVGIIALLAAIITQAGNYIILQR